MSFLKKTLASFGIGSAKVDSILNQDVLYPGQSVDVSIHVYGGATEQAIDNIDLKLFTRYIAEALRVRKVFSVLLYKVPRKRPRYWVR